MMKNKQDKTYPFSLIMIMLGAILVQNCGQEALAQLEIPEAEPIGTVGSTVANASNHLVFEDLDYKVEYPDNWEVIAPGVLYGLSAFQAPDGSVLTVKFIPAEDADVDNLDDLADLLEGEGGTQVAQSYKNSSTTLGGLPAFIQTGVYTYTPTEETGQANQEDLERDTNEVEPDDTFVGSAGDNGEENDE